MKFTKETLKRALRTFIQAAVAYIVANITLVDFSDKSIVKSAVIGLITSALAAGISAVMNLEKPEQLGGDRAIMPFNSFVKSYLGKKTDWDGVYGVQCVDLIDAYIEKCLGLKVGYFGNAKTWWVNRNDKWLSKYFTPVTLKYKDGELRAGDIGIRTGGTYGHIFIVKEPTKKGKITYYDQNYNGTGAGMTERTVPYNSTFINGVLRPKDQSPFPKVKKKYGNAKIKSDQTVYADSTLKNKVGTLFKNDRLMKYGTIGNSCVVAYPVSSGYKVGFVPKNKVIDD